jgi:large subunit ribosomal protein L30
VSGQALGKILLVLRLKGTVDVRNPVKKTLNQLHLKKKFSATILPDRPEIRGMLRTSKEFIAWSPVSSSVISNLLKERGRKTGWSSITVADVKKMGFKNFTDMAKSLEKGDKTLSSIKDMKPYFSLPPPRGGFKRSTRRNYGQGGILGENPELTSILEQMLPIKKAKEKISKRT